MDERQVVAIVRDPIDTEALARWPIARVGVIHRLGRLEIGEASVVIAVTSAHRAPAFEACRFAIDQLKKTVPIWKKEYFADGAVWVEGEWDESLRRGTPISTAGLSR